MLPSHAMCSLLLYSRFRGMLSLISRYKSAFDPVQRELPRQLMPRALAREKARLAVKAATMRAANVVARIVVECRG